MPVGQEGLRRVLDAFEAGEWDEIHVVADDVEVHLIAKGDALDSVETSHVLVAPSAGSTTRATQPDPAAEQRAGSDLAGDPGASAEGVQVVRAPTPGIFWRAPSPGAPPFVETGGRVDHGATLCIVEVMKLMNTLPAPVTGIVLEIGAANGEQVDAGRVLFRIQAAGPADIDAEEGRRG